MAVGSMIWYEIWVSDLDRAKAFYQRLFNWTFEPFIGYDPENYWLIRTENPNQSTGGALVRRPEEGTPNSARSCVVYVQVNDLNAAVDNAVQQGGSLVDPARKIGDVDGQFSLIQDPDGNQIGLWTP